MTVIQTALNMFDIMVIIGDDIVFFLYSIPFRVGVKCSYAESSSIKDAATGTIDVLADIKTEKV